MTRTARSALIVVLSVVAAATPSVVASPRPEPFKGTFTQAGLGWSISLFDEYGCAANGIAGAEIDLYGSLSHLGHSLANVSAAWDWNVRAQGIFNPMGPTTGLSATVLPATSRAYPYGFSHDPFAGGCTPTPVVSATGMVKITGTNGDRLFGTIVGGEVYELGFARQGDGQESFLIVQIVGGAGRLAGAAGSFVAHAILRYDSAARLVLIRGEILPGGTIVYVP